MDYMKTMESEMSGCIFVGLLVVNIFLFKSENEMDSQGILHQPLIPHVDGEC